MDRSDLASSAASPVPARGAVPEMRLNMQDLADLVTLERQQSQASDWYQIFLLDNVTGDLVHVRAPAFRLDSSGRKHLSPNGRFMMFHPVDVALNVWGACGADETTFVAVLKGPVVVATAADLAEYVHEMRVRAASDEAAAA